MGLTLALALSSPRAARAEEANSEGRVLGLYGDDVVVDLSQHTGAKAGAVVELWRPLKLKHPVTGAELSDQFLIGRLRLTQVRARLTLARPQGKLDRAVEVGDIVVLRGARPSSAVHAPATPREATPAPAATVSPPGGATSASVTTQVLPAPANADTDAVEIGALLESVQGKGLRERVLAYEGYVRKNPNGRYAVVLWEEAQKLRELLGGESARSEKSPSLRAFSAPAEALAGTPLSLAVELSDATGAVLHVRHPSEPAYTTLPMSSAGDGYYRATVPGTLLRPPAAEYFIEAVRSDGKAVAVSGDARNPNQLDLVRTPLPRPPLAHDSVASIWTDYAVWNMQENNDNTWQTEGFVGIRLEDVGVRALRTGFGVYRGRGGSLEELDSQGLGGRSVGFTYGYLEGELGLSHFTGLIGRAVVGLDKSGLAGGAQLLLRLGNDRKTNLQLGGEVLGDIGVRGITQLELATFPKVPLLFRTEVTNQPAGNPAEGGSFVNPTTSVEQGEVGARVIAQVGYRFVPELTLALRASYQGRTINHAGPGVGGGITYTW